MKILTKEQILLLHSQLVKEFGGSLDIRDDSLLESAINTPFQTYGGEERECEKKSVKNNPSMIEYK